jgi:hypothetical protein
VLEFVPASARSVDPLMGWTSSSDMNSQVRLRFDTLEAAQGLCRRSRDRRRGRAAQDAQAQHPPARLRRELRDRPPRGMDALSSTTAGRPDDPAVSPLIARHAAHGDAHYPAESNHHQDGAAMAAEGVVLFVGLLNGAAVAMGGYKIIAPGDGEVKSMHVTMRRAGRARARASSR